MLGGCAYERKAQMPMHQWHHLLIMADLPKVLADNLQRLMEYHRFVSDEAVGKAAGVNQKTVWRIRNHAQSPTVEMLEKVASAFALHAWQMLIPNLDPRNPPTSVMSEEERRFYRRMEELRTAEPPAHPYNSQ